MTRGIRVPAMARSRSLSDRMLRVSGLPRGSAHVDLAGESNIGQSKLASGPYM